MGRHGEVDTVAAWFQQAAQGARQLAFVSGPAGVGKTTVVELWLARLAAESGVRIAWGHCVEHVGEGEPYLPLLEVLGDLSRGPQPRGVLDTLRRAAPLWLVQLPGLLPDTELERLQRQVQGATATRMLRELAEALEVLSAETPLVVVLEDLQWSDRPTVEALAYVAQRRAPARLLVLGTYRPVDAAPWACPAPHGARAVWTGQAVDCAWKGYPPQRWRPMSPAAGGPVAARLAAFIHERTEGHALFLVTIVEHLVGQGLVVQRAGQWTLPDGAAAQVRSLPDGLRQFLLRRLEALPPAERRVLEAASVVGERFAVAAVAAGANARWRRSRRCAKRWRRSSTSSPTWACGRGRMAPGGAATAFSMPCTSRSCMTRSGRRGGCSSTGALACAWRRGMVRGPGDRCPAGPPLRARR